MTKHSSKYEQDETSTLLSSATRAPSHEEDDGGNNATSSCWADFYATNHFLIKAVLAIVVAKLYPPLGGHILQPQITGQWLAVMFIFGMAGILIKTSELGEAVQKMKFNLFVLGFNFFVVSAVVYWSTRVLLQYQLINDGMADGMIVCSCMPMSVSMVIVFTRTAMGDTACATLIAPTSSLLSVVISPMLILYYIGTKTEINLPSVVVKLLLRVLLPMVVGQGLQYYTPSVVVYIEHHLTKFKAAQEYALIFIVYTVFCKTFQQTIDGAGLWDILKMAVCQFALLCVMFLVAWLVLKVLFYNEPRLRVMGLYGCVQKSAAVGIPLIGAIYENDPKLAGLYTLPLLIWHPSQMIVGSALVPYLADGVQKLEAHLAGTTTTTGIRHSFFGSQTTLRPSPHTKQMIKRALGSVAFDDDAKVLRDINHALEADLRASLTEVNV